jgi:hypothetical protein
MNDDLTRSPLGDRRENPVPCQRCRKNTINFIPICNACIKQAEKEKK